MFTGFISHPAFWAVLGLGLLLAELFMPALLLAFFGIGALGVAVLTFFGIISSLPEQLLAFAGLSVAALFLLRKRFRRTLHGKITGDTRAARADDSLIGSNVIVESDFKQGLGKVKLRGTSWNAESDEDLRAGDLAWVRQHRGIVLMVSKNKLKAK